MIGHYRMRIAAVVAQGAESLPRCFSSRCLSFEGILCFVVWTLAYGCRYFENFSFVNFFVRYNYLLASLANFGLVASSYFAVVIYLKPHGNLDFAIFNG